MNNEAADSKVVLFATDFSATADGALAEATAVARDRGARLVILHVQGPLVAYAMTGPGYSVPETESETLQAALEAVVPPDNRIACEHRLVLGDAATEIIRIARNENVDMIVMGSHGRKGLSRLLMGSVAETVLRQAPCPVLIYRGPQPAAVAEIRQAPDGPP